MAKLHDSEITVTLSLANQLIKEQFPQWSHLSIEPLNGNVVVLGRFRSV